MKKALIYFALSIFVMITIFPFLWLISTSLKPQSEVLSTELVGFFKPNFENYKTVLFTGRFLERLWNSVVISLSTVLIAVPIGSMAGYAFARMNIKRKDNYFFAILTTRMAPPVAFGVPFYLLMTRSQLIDTHLGLISVYIFMNLALCIWLTRGFFEEIPVELEEAAYVDGCSKLMSFLRITLPLSIGGIITTAVLVFIFSWNEFFFASILTRTEVTTYPIHLLTYFGTIRIYWGQLTAAATIVSAIPILFAILTRKYIVRGFSLGAVKITK